MDTKWMKLMVLDMWWFKILTYIFDPLILIGIEIYDFNKDHLLFVFSGTP